VHEVTQTTEAPSLDPALIEEQMGRVFGHLSGVMASMGIWLGDHLGLYQAMAGAGPLTSHDLAAKTGLHERWVREWLSLQAAAGIVDHERAETFELGPVMALILADESTPMSMAGFFSTLPALVTMTAKLPDSFRSGVGRKYDDHGLDAAVGTQRATAPTTGIFTDLAIPALEGVPEKLERGAKVADIGCGAGGRLIALASSYPASRFLGYDISEIALGLGRENAAKAGVSNVTFHNPETDPLPGDGSFDLVTFGDVVHDLAHPGAVLAAARRALKPDGTMLVIDIAAAETLSENIAHPMATLLFGTSLAVCLSSSLSEEGGAGIGTMGLSQSRLKEMCEQAGFSRFRRTDVADQMNAYYEIRP
jgi:ubiquinone/menaquinone biosynthesis C-methylase UbiE